MERVTFLIERTGDRISCLLNPESLEARRTAGLARRRTATGGLLGNPRSDDPLIATGGGITEYDLQLLFDVDIANEGRRPPQPPAPPVASLPSLPDTSVPSAEAEDASASPAAEPEQPADPQPAPDPQDEPAPPSPEAALDDGTGAGDPVEADPASGSIPEEPAAEPAPPPLFDPPPPDPGLVTDVRELTQPLWALAENGERVEGSLVQSRIRFIWGKSWNVPGVVIAVAERLECFDIDGVPRRSWLSLRLRRVEEDPEGVSAAPPSSIATPQFQMDQGSDPVSGQTVHYLTIPVDSDGNVLLRHDQIAAMLLNDASRGLEICDKNGINHPFRSVEGSRIQVAVS